MRCQLLVNYSNILGIQPHPDMNQPCPQQRVQEGQFYTSEPVAVNPCQSAVNLNSASPPRHGSYLISHRSISGWLFSHFVSEKWILFLADGRQTPVKCNLFQDHSVIWFTLNIITVFSLCASQRLLAADRHQRLLLSPQFASKCK